MARLPGVSKTEAIQPSIWVEYLRRGKGSKSAPLDDLLVAGEVLVCGPVLAELLAGVKSADRGRLWLLLTGLPWADLDPRNSQELWIGPTR